MGGDDAIGHAMTYVPGAAAAAGQEYAALGTVILLQVPPAVPGYRELRQRIIVQIGNQPDREDHGIKVLACDLVTGGVADHWTAVLGDDLRGTRADHLDVGGRQFFQCSIIGTKAPPVHDEHGDRELGKLLPEGERLTKRILAADRGALGRPHLRRA